jgi:hypothetical protein
MYDCTLQSIKKNNELETDTKYVCVSVVTSICMEVMRMSQLCVWTLMSAALGLTRVILMPSVSTNQETLPASAKQDTLEMEVTAKVSTPSMFADSPLTSLPFHSHPNK